MRVVAGQRFRGQLPAALAQIKGEATCEHDPPAAGKRSSLPQEGKDRKRGGVAWKEQEEHVNEKQAGKRDRSQ